MSLTSADERWTYVEKNTLEEIAARLDLREPNQEALISIALALTDHYDRFGKPPTFEGVIDSATGVGKTYVLAAAIEYLALVRGIRNFAVVTPGRTILEKTVGNFRVGHPKSLLGPMVVRPVVITADNFTSPAMRASMDDPEQVKLYVFTVQSLVRPETKLGRRTHKFQEGLGSAFYQYLQNLGDLVVFADEHHCYFGPAFSDAVRDLRPWALIGLTATPHPRTPEEQIIYKYPLGAAVAAQLVKTPVLVGRKDDRKDPETKINDAARLLEIKEQAMNAWCEGQGMAPVRPVMLVVAQTIEEAKQYAEIIQSDGFRGGRYATPGSVLVVTSESSDEALAKLDSVEDSSSPVRVIVSVGMLKEGWDVKNVYVIVSMRASVSEILTEQTLGRGLRLPFGKYTGEQILDTLEVVAHERYDELLRRAGLVNEQLIDYRIRMVVERDAEGQLTVARERQEVSGRVLPVTHSQGLDARLKQGEPGVSPGAMTLQVSDIGEREAAGQSETDALRTLIRPRPGLPPVMVPILQQDIRPASVSLADVVAEGLERFRRLGRQLGADPDEELRRTLVRAKVVTGPDGVKHTEFVPAEAEGKIESEAPLFPVEGVTAQLETALRSTQIVLARASEANAAKEIVQAFLEGLNGDLQKLLSAYYERASYRLLKAVGEALREYSAPVVVGEVVSLRTLAPERKPPATQVSDERRGVFRRHGRYIGWKKSMHDEVWFDSSPERDVANLLDDADDVEVWVRLLRNDLPILWQDVDRTARWYNPDFIVVERNGTQWIVEVKADGEMQDADVRQKRRAANRWATNVSLDPSVGVTWRYLLVSESDVETVKESWGALRKLATD